jgi:ABC-type sugar transport system substrate-binding protein
MKKFHRAAALVLALALLALCVGCGSTQTAYDRKVATGKTEGSTLKIAYSAVANSDSAPWAGVLWDEIEKACNENGWEFVGKSAGGVPSAQANQIDELVAEDPDYIIIFAGDEQLADEWVRKLHKKGVPVIMVGMDAGGDAQGYVSAYVGADQEALAAQLAVDMIIANGEDAELNVVSISGFECQQDYVLREQGFKKTLSYYSGYTLLANQYAGASRDEAKSIMDDYFDKYGDSIDIVMCYDDEFALGAAESVEEHGKTGEIQIYSITGCNEAIEAVKDGVITETAMISASEMAQRCAEVIDGLDTGIIPDHYCYTSRTYINADNVDSYIGNGEY